MFQTDLILNLELIIILYLVSQSLNNLKLSMDIVSLAYCSSSRKSISTKISYTHALEYWPPGPNSAISDSSIPSQIQKKGLTGISDANVLFLIHSPNTNILFWIHYHVFLINVISKWTHDFLEISNIFPMYFLVSSAVILCNDFNYFLPVGLNILKYLKEKKSDEVVLTFKPENILFNKKTYCLGSGTLFQYLLLLSPIMLH